MTSTTMAPTIASVRRAVRQMLARGGIDSAEADSRLLIAHALDIERATVLSHGDRALTADETRIIEALVLRRLAHEPVARIVGHKEFWSLLLAIDDAVLVPRPETETVVELVLDTVVRDALRMENLRILDIGTGTGALLLALLSELREAEGVGTDISEKAIAAARTNAERHRLDARCGFVCCDVAAGLTGPYELIVSNPPYVARGEIANLPSDVRNYDPRIALDGGVDGLDFYRAIVGAARRLLRPGGRVVVEIGQGQAPAVSAIFERAGFDVGSPRNDLAGIPRAVGAQIGS